MAKLREDDKRKIRDLYRAGMTQYELAQMFGVSQPTVSSVIRGKTGDRPDTELIVSVLQAQTEMLIMLLRDETLTEEDEERIRALAGIGRK